MSKKSRQVQVSADVGGRLHDLRLRSPRSEAVLFDAKWDDVDVVVKVHVPEAQRYWMAEVSKRTSSAVAHVFASGATLGDFEVRWLVVEQLPERPPRPATPAWFEAVLDAAFAFQLAARTMETEHAYDEALDVYGPFVVAHADEAPGPADRMVRTLADDWEWALATFGRDTLFGDLTFGNAAARARGDSLEVRLFDPIPRRQPWVFDPAYFEVVGRGEGLVRSMAARRRAAGLATPSDDDVDRAATLFLGWMAVMWWGLAPALRADPTWCKRSAERVTAAAALDR